jgi:hypothetical protein
MTIVGLLTMNIGEAMTGRGRLRRTGGRFDIGAPDAGVRLRLTASLRIHTGRLG